MIRFGSLSASQSGDVAQLGEHHVRNVGAGGSNPLISTKFTSRLDNQKTLSDLLFYETPDDQYADTLTNSKHWDDELFDAIVADLEGDVA